ncbi:PHP domain-containing protein [Marinisporobacter balticus]|uniref:Polymerase/histidinol phosphatase N-terminal domain-containing protein n=1 Tax=Marinisporobacter balticus TaxID=2018667 RepID=A0A4R2L6Z6_9FIRM|nr:PHP domain-containing protein [Marinisporobacter balticus]TCO79879.1 hypothetical protein EV214_101113 [Marinisporobacter balticus]
MGNIDMHVHTRASDGILSPNEIVDWAKKLGLMGIAITDHDTVEGIEDAIEASKEYSDFFVIPGIELSAIYNDVEIHVLGYFIDFKNKEIIKITDQIKNHRIQRAKLIVEKLIKIGYEITFTEVCDIAKAGAVGRPHIAKVLLRKGYVSSIQEAFEKLLIKGQDAYVERFKLTMDEAINVIENANGIPVLAHPRLIDSKISIEDVLKKGIKGIEVYHTRHSYLHSQIYLKLAQKYNLFITGGSDYHDEMINDKPTIGSVSVPYHTIISMKNK